MNTMVYTHAAYIALGIAATIWVTWTLSRRGRPFLERWWGDGTLAAAWGHLLSVGIYLLHVGCLLLALRLGTQAATQAEAIEVVATKMGIVLLALAVTHFLHVKAFWLMLHAAPREKPVVINAEMVGSGSSAGV